MTNACCSNCCYRLIPVKPSDGLWCLRHEHCPSVDMSKTCYSQHTVSNRPLHCVPQGCPRRRCCQNVFMCWQRSTSWWKSVHSHTMPGQMPVIVGHQGFELLYKHAEQCLQRAVAATAVQEGRSSTSSVMGGSSADVNSTSTISSSRGRGRRRRSARRSLRLAPVHQATAAALSAARVISTLPGRRNECFLTRTSWPTSCCGC
jgi:hypothetical protein